MNATSGSETPRVKLPDGRVVQIGPDWFGKLSGFTLLFDGAGAGAGPGPADALCRGRQAGQRVLAPRACHLFTLCRSRPWPTAEAKEALGKALAIAPDPFEPFGRPHAAWRRPEDLAHLLEGLRKAGIPEE
jgi:hypothetical protein